MSKHTVWNEELRDLLKVYVSNGYSTKEIALEMDIPFNTIKRKRRELGISATPIKYTDEELLNWLRETDNPSSRTFSGGPNKVGYSVYVTRFGSWNNALKLAGHKTTKTYTNEELLSILRDAPTKTYNHFNEPNELPSAVTYKKRFGSWNNALDLAGIPRNGFSLVEDKETLVYLVEFGSYYKVGITQQSLESRFGGYPDYEIVLTLNCKSLKEAKAIESEWLHNVNKLTYYAPDFPRNNGSTECFKF